MIDRAALETVIKTHAEQMAAGALTLELHLFSGEVFCVNQIAEYFDGYFVALVYPKEPLSEERIKELIPRDDGGRLVFDRAVISYQTVSYVLLTARESEKRGKLGFNA